MLTCFLSYSMHSDIIENILRFFIAHRWRLHFTAAWDYKYIYMGQSVHFNLDTTTDLDFFNFIVYFFFHDVVLDLKRFSDLLGRHFEEISKIAIRVLFKKSF